MQMEVYTCKLMACRFRALDRMEEDRKAILLNHLGFIQRAYRECCPFHDHCVDNLLDQTLTAHSKRLTYTVCCIMLKIDQNTTNEKKHLERRKLCAPKFFAPPQTPFPGMQDCQNLMSCTYRPCLVKIDARNFELSW